MWSTDDINVGNFGAIATLGVDVALKGCPNVPGRRV